MERKITGKLLQQVWDIPAKHVLYNRDGIWYHQLRQFPGALCDSSGYVLFPTEELFRNCKQLKINKDVGCRTKIASIPNYLRQESSAAIDLSEPKKSRRILQIVSRIIRDTAIANELKLDYKHVCQLCGKTTQIFDRFYSEAHHIKPLGADHDGDDTRDNLLCVCPTCHVQLDYRAIPLDVSTLKVHKHKISLKNIDYHNQLYRSQLSSLHNGTSNL